MLDQSYTRTVAGATLPLPNRRCCARSADDGTDWNLFVDLESGLILLTEKAIVLDYRFEGGQTGGTGDFIGQMADEVQPAERTYSLAGAIAPPAGRCRGRAGPTG
jgi:hypothetical protein